MKTNETKVKLQNKLTGLFFKVGENFSAKMEDATEHTPEQVAFIRATFGDHFREVPSGR